MFLSSISLKLLGGETKALSAFLPAHAQTKGYIGFQVLGLNPVAMEYLQFARRLASNKCGDSTHTDRVLVWFFVCRVMVFQIERQPMLLLDRMLQLLRLSPGLLRIDTCCT